MNLPVATATKRVATRRFFRGLTALLALSLTSCPSDLTEALQLLGYTPVRPASQFWQPGALIYVRNWDPFEVGYICTAQQVMGRDYVPMRSPTVDADLARRERQGINLGGQYADLLAGDAALEAVKSVEVELRHAQVAEVSDSDVDHRLGRVDPACGRNLERRRRQGYAITMISSAFVADVSYRVQFHRGAKLDAQGQLATLGDLAGKLGVESASFHGRTIESRGLVWGIRDDQYLAYLFAPSAVAPVAAPGARLLPETQVPVLQGHVTAVQQTYAPDYDYTILDDYDAGEETELGPGGPDGRR